MVFKCFRPEGISLPTSYFLPPHRNKKMYLYIACQGPECPITCLLGVHFSFRSDDVEGGNCHLEISTNGRKDSQERKSKVFKSQRWLLLALFLLFTHVFLKTFNWSEILALEVPCEVSLFMAPHAPPSGSGWCRSHHTLLYSSVFPGKSVAAPEFVSRRSTGARTGWKDTKGLVLKSFLHSTLWKMRKYQLFISRMGRRSWWSWSAWPTLSTQPLSLCPSLQCLWPHFWHLHAFP